MRRSRSSPGARLAAALSMLLAACGAISAIGVMTITTGCSREPILEQTFDSPEAVARAVLKGLDARDVNGLKGLAVTEHEFRRIVWPKLPAARPGRNIPWDYVWNDLHGKSTMQLQARVNEWRQLAGASVAPAGPVEVARVEFTGVTTDYETFRVKRKSVVVLRSAAGVETRHRVFGSIIEEAGRYKVFSYVVD